jgi:FlaA1/EpsC-like NDP-sugar epimerase
MATTLQSSSILITGGTGSIGKDFVKTLLRPHPDIKRPIAFSRDELTWGSPRSQRRKSRTSGFLKCGRRG